MKERVTTGLALFFIVLVMFLTKIIIQTPIIFDVFVLLLAVLASMESATLFQKTGRFSHSYMIYVFPVVATGLMLLAMNLKWSVAITLVAFIGLILVMTIISAVISLCTVARTENEMRARRIRTSKLGFAVKKGLNAILGYVYPSLLVLMLIPINHLADISYIFETTFTDVNLLSTVFLALCFIIPCLCDIFAYIMGNLIGGKRLAIRISPKKTISGAIGGVLWTTLITTVLFLIFVSIPAFDSMCIAIGLEWWIIAIISFVGAIICVLGDLVESALKRKADVKDSGNLLPGHGGIMDRIDGLSLVVIVIFIALVIIV